MASRNHGARLVVSVALLGGLLSWPGTVRAADPPPPGGGTPAACLSGTAPNLSSTGSGTSFTSSEVNGYDSYTLLYRAEGLTPPTSAPTPSVFENNLATTPAALLNALYPAGGVNGIPANTSNGITGSSSTPGSATTFAAGWLEESEMYEYPNYATSGPTSGSPPGSKTAYYSPGAYDQAYGEPLSTLPSNTVTHVDGTTSTDRGMPYAAILSSDVKTIIAVLPVKIAAENYTPSQTAWMPPKAGTGNQPTPNCSVGTSGDNLFELLTFNAAPLYQNGTLRSGQTYAAYLLVRDTDVSGPLSDHLWYFSKSPTFAPVSRLRVTYQARETAIRWRSAERVAGYDVYSGNRKLNRTLVTSRTSWYRFVTSGHFGKSTIRLVPVSG